MKKTTVTLVQSALASILAIGVSGIAGAEAPQQGEKCYGISKAGKNDCQTAASACAGTSKEDSNPTAFIYVPKGTCDKIVGGSTTPKG